MLNLRPVRLGWRESVSLRRFQNYNLLEMPYFHRYGVEDEPEREACGFEERHGGGESGHLDILLS